MAISYGNNNLGSLSSYRERNLYDSLSFLDRDLQAQLDLRKLHLFGKVDTKGNLMLLPKKQALLSSGIIKLVPKTDVYTFSFLMPLLNDMMDRFGKEGYLSTRGVISQNSSLASLQPKKSLVFWEDEYEKHVKSTKDAFLNFYSGRYSSKDIKNFSDYIKVFESFVSEACPYSVLTLKSFLVSRFCDPMVSGMFVEFASADASDDYEKYKTYILDSSYPKLLEDAAFNGLIVDKHVPWRFAINPNSAEMLETLKTAGYKNFQDFLKKTYVDPTALNFELFTKMVIDIYRTLTFTEPNYLSLKYVDDNPAIDIGERENIMISNCHPLFDNLGMEKTLRLYMSIRMREANMNLTQQEFNGKAQIALNYQKTLDLRRAILYIDDLTRTPDLENTKKPTYRI